MKQSSKLFRRGRSSSIKVGHEGYVITDSRAAEIIGKDYEPFGGALKADFEKLFGNAKYTKWPAEENKDGLWVNATFKQGIVVDKFGDIDGEYMSPLRGDGKPYSFSQRAISPWSISGPYALYQFKRDTKVMISRIAPYFNQEGCGLQFVVPCKANGLDCKSKDRANIKKLVAAGIIGVNPSRTYIMSKEVMDFMTNIERKVDQEANLKACLKDETKVSTPPSLS